MSKRKQKLSRAEKEEKERRKKEFMTIFLNGKMKRVKRPPTIDGMDVDEFIRRNADPVWLQQNEMWEYMNETGMKPDFMAKPSLCASCAKDDDPNEEMLCNMNRLDQQGEKDFKCFAYEPKKT